MNKAENGSKTLTELAFIFILVLLVKVADSCEDCLKPEDSDQTSSEVVVEQQQEPGEGGGGVVEAGMEIVVSGNQMKMNGEVITVKEVIDRIHVEGYTAISIQASPGVAELMQYATEHAVAMTIK